MLRGLKLLRASSFVCSSLDWSENSCKVFASNFSITAAFVLREQSWPRRHVQPEEYFCSLIGRQERRKQKTAKPDEMVNMFARRQNYVTGRLESWGAWKIINFPSRLFLRGKFEINISNARSIYFFKHSSSHDSTFLAPPHYFLMSIINIPQKCFDKSFHVSQWIVFRD